MKLIYAVQDFMELNTIISLSSVIVWTSKNCFNLEMAEIGKYNEKYHRLLKHNHMVLLRYKIIWTMNIIDILFEIIQK